jgi:hypothetical protein
MSEIERECAANYRQPPLNTRFQEGPVRQPRGRPVNNTAALLAAALNEMARGRPSPRTGSAGRSPSARRSSLSWSTKRPWPICGTSKKGGAEKKPFGPTDK